MGFQDAVRTCFRKYVTFSGRAPRSEYWWFVLFLVLGAAVFGMIDRALFGTTLVQTGPGQITVQSNGPLAQLFSLATFLPALAAAWRRMHDTGRSGLFVLYPLIVMVGIVSFVGFVAGFEPLMRGDVSGLLAGTAGLIIALAMFVLLLSPLLVLWWLTRPSQPGTNDYGPNPYEVTP